MKLNKYQKEAKTTRIYGERYNILYPLLGLSGEVGEFCNKYKKVLRDEQDIDIQDLKKELGDVLWYISALSSDLGLDLEDIAQANLDKLKKRVVNGTLQSSGDDR